MSEKTIHISRLRREIRVELARGLYEALALGAGRVARDDHEAAVRAEEQLPRRDVPAPASRVRTVRRTCHN